MRLHNPGMGMQDSDEGGSVLGGRRMGGHGDDDVVHTRIRFRAVGVEHFLVAWLLIMLTMVASCRVSRRHPTAFGSTSSHEHSPPIFPVLHSASTVVSRLISRA